MTKSQVEKAIREAYKNGKKIGTQGESVVVQGSFEGMEIKMYVNKETKIIETAYPTK